MVLTRIKLLPVGCMNFMGNGMTHIHGCFSKIVESKNLTPQTLDFSSPEDRRNILADRQIAESRLGSLCGSTKLLIQ